MMKPNKILTRGTLVKAGRNLVQSRYLKTPRGGDILSQSTKRADNRIVSFQTRTPRKISRGFRRIMGRRITPTEKGWKA